jgi:3-phenylpropionate/cinnamic acid dioxygenase small subunit
MRNAEQAAPVLTRADAEDFLYREARLLDEGHWREWQKLFMPDALYWLPSSAAPEVDPDNYISIIYDDMDLLNERLGRLESGACHAQIPSSRTLHVIGNVMVSAAENHAVVFSNQVIHEYRSNTQSRFYPLQAFPAHCEHHLRWHACEWKMAFKKVQLLNCDGEIFDLSFLI